MTIIDQKQIKFGKEMQGEGSDFQENLKKEAGRKKSKDGNDRGDGVSLNYLPYATVVKLSNRDNAKRNEIRPGFFPSGGELWWS